MCIIYMCVYVVYLAMYTGNEILAKDNSTFARKLRRTVFVKIIQENSRAKRFN